ncbi:hypothetical protein LSCM4_02555 [Leishmania orientalis]|uniref:mitogen-activated protein kinase kinase n=1 Tax=Leishmania orientalis TaxID=2249476 RepID=A0A836GK43_9TRYP|nr:hypothetical protein LSCM4_02555 [Leishmania orientalis]
MREDRHVAKRHEARGASLRGSTESLDTLSSSRSGALSATFTFPTNEAAAAHCIQDSQPSEGVKSSSIIEVPVMVCPVTMPAAAGSFAQRRSSLSPFATAPSSCPAPPPRGAATKAATSLEDPGCPGAAEEVQGLKPLAAASVPEVSAIGRGGEVAAAAIRLPPLRADKHNFEGGRGRHQPCESEVSISLAASAPLGARATAPLATPGTSRRVSSGGGHLRIPSTRSGKVNGGGSMASSSVPRSNDLPAEKVESRPVSRLAAGPRCRESRSANENSPFDRAEVATPALGGGAASLQPARRGLRANSSWSPVPDCSKAQAQMRPSPKLGADSHCLKPHHHSAGAPFTETRTPSSCGPGGSSAGLQLRTCRMPVSIAVVLSTFVTVVLVATLTIVPLSAVSIQSANYVMSTLSISLASSYTRSVEASMLFLPNAIRAYAFAYMGSSEIQAWNWTAADMPQAMRQMCHTVAGTNRNPTSFLLYMSLSSPYTGYSAFCSQQYSNDYLIGNFITDNSSQPRYFVNGTTYDYIEPRIIYRAVQAMTPWEYTVDFGGTENAWHSVVVPWYERYKETWISRVPESSVAVRKAATDRNVTSSAEPVASLTNPLQYLKGYWRVFTYNNVSIITFTFPFVDYANNPASISGALQVDGFDALHPDGLIAASTSARAMVVDASSGLVIITSWGQDTSVRMDNWNTSCNCTPGGNDMRAVYLEDITDPLMIAAVKNVGGRRGIADSPYKLDRWTGHFTVNKTENFMVVSRVHVSPNYSAVNIVVIYAMRKSEFIDFVNHVQRIAIIAVVTVLIIIVLVEVLLMYLLVQPVRGVAAGLRAAAELRDGSECVDVVPSLIKEVAEMQDDFRVMNTKLMQMKTFLPQGMLGAQITDSDPQGASDAGAFAHPTSALHMWDGGGPWKNAHEDDGYGAPGNKLGVYSNGDVGAARRGSEAADNELDSGLMVTEAGEGRRQGCHQPVGKMTNLSLNDRVLLEEVNHFRRCYCSTIVFCMHLMESEMSVKFLNEHCVYFAEGVLPCVLRYGGVVELQRPDYIVVSFGAHNKVALHQNRAAKCALEVMYVLNATTPIGPRVGCLIDASEYYVGTCGAADRNALVAFSHSLAPKGDLIRVLKSVQTQILLTQRLASTLDSSMLLMPVDCMVLNPIAKKEIVLYELRGHIGMLPWNVSVAMVRQVIRAVRMGFTHMLKGDYGKALEALKPYETTELQAARLAFMCGVFITRNIHRPFVRSVTRLTFSEARFAGYTESGATAWSESHASGTSLRTHRRHSLSDGCLEAKNPLASGGGIGGCTSSFSFSPFSKDLDPATLLTPSPTLRLVVGAPLGSYVPSKEDSERSNERGATAGAVLSSTHADKCSLTVHRSGAPTEEEFRQDDWRVAAASRAAADEGETALFELFVEDQPDDDDVDEGETGAGGMVGEAGDVGYYGPCDKAKSSSGDGAGELQVENSTAATRVTSGATRLPRKRELPLFFNDYEGNAWRRSCDILGTGAFSTVYRGLSMSGNLVALKCFQLGARNIEVHAIVDEVRLFANLHHENVVQYLSLYVSESYVIEIMEFVPGGSLDTLLKSFGSLRPESVRRYLRDIARGLNYLHTANIVHCDIKPHNVLLAMDGQCKLSDFGSAIARATSSICKIDDVLEMRGTPGYMAPEVARGDVPTMKSDVYSLGITILELLTGKLPWVYADAFAPRSSWKLTPTRSSAEHHASQLLSSFVLPLGGASVTDSLATQAGAILREKELSAELAATQLPASGLVIDSRLSVSTLLNMSYTQPLFSMSARVCSRGSGLLSAESYSVETKSGFRSLTLSHRGGAREERNSNPPLKALASTWEEGASAAATFLSTTNVLDLACFRPNAKDVAPLAYATAAEDAVAKASHGDGFGTPLGTLRRRPPDVLQSRLLPLGDAAIPFSASRSPSDLISPLFQQTRRYAASPHREPIERVLRNAAQLVVCIGRGLVVPHIPDTLDEDVKDFLEMCLKPDPAERASMSELMLHPWLM